MLRGAMMRQDAMKQEHSLAAKLCGLAVALTVLAGCENPYIVQLKDEFGWTEARMLRDGWLKSYPIGQPAVYCYHTIADADCFPAQKKDQKDRLINPSYNGDF